MIVFLRKVFFKKKDDFESEGLTSYDDACERGVAGLQPSRVSYVGTRKCAVQWFGIVVSSNSHERSIE